MSDNDDSEAREIAGTWFDPDEPITWEDLVNCAKAGVARGRALGAREAEKLVRSRADVAYVITDTAAPKTRTALHNVADAIARRAGRGT